MITWTFFLKLGGSLWLTRGQRHWRSPPLAVTHHRWSNSDTETWGQTRTILITSYWIVYVTRTDNVLQLDTALAYIIIVAAVWTATPLCTVVKVTRLCARQSSAWPAAWWNTGAVQHTSEAHHTCTHTSRPGHTFERTKATGTWKERRGAHHIPTPVTGSQCGPRVWSRGTHSEPRPCTNSCSRNDRPGSDTAAGRCLDWCIRDTEKTHSPSILHTGMHRILEYTANKYIIWF